MPDDGRPTMPNNEEEFYEFEEKEHKALCSFFKEGGILDRIIRELEVSAMRSPDPATRAAVEDLREEAERVLKEFREACSAGYPRGLELGGFEFRLGRERATR
jgi:hypothetical protein